MTVSPSSRNTQKLAAQWARMGVAFNVRVARQSPDIERLLIETAQVASIDARLFEMAVSWIIQNAELVAVHRLGALAAVEPFNSEASAVLGLMLELAQTTGARRSLRAATNACRPRRPGGPLFDIDRRSESSCKFAKVHAMAASKRWGCWVDAFEPHPAAIRSRAWIVSNNRSAIKPRLTLSDADLSAWLALCEYGEKSHAAEIARQAGISRMQALRSIHRLSQLGYVSEVEPGSRRRLVAALEG